MLLHQLHMVDGHAPVHRLAHVINGQQGHLHRSQSFHFHTGLAVGFNGRGATHADFFKVIYTTSRWVGWTKIGQENLTKQSVIQKQSGYDKIIDLKESS